MIHAITKKKFQLFSFNFTKLRKRMDSLANLDSVIIVNGTNCT